MTPQHQGGGMPSDLRQWEGYLRRTDGSIVPCATEEAFFATLGVPWIEPRERTEQNLRRVLRKTFGNVGL